MDKKGVEISMNVIIVAAIGLLVLVVLSVIFLGRIGTFGQKTGDCVVQGGTCAPVCGGDEGALYGTEDMKKNPLLTCPEVAGETEVCCIPVSV